jgi:hypothetical protein
MNIYLFYLKILNNSLNEKEKFLLVLFFIKELLKVEIWIILNEQDQMLKEIYGILR